METVSLSSETTVTTDAAAASTLALIDLSIYNGEAFSKNLFDLKSQGVHWVTLSYIKTRFAGGKWMNGLTTIAEDEVLCNAVVQLANALAFDACQYRSCNDEEAWKSRLSPGAFVAVKNIRTLSNKRQFVCVVSRNDVGKELAYWGYLRVVFAAIGGKTSPLGKNFSAAVDLWQRQRRAKAVAYEAAIAETTLQPRSAGVIASEPILCPICDYTSNSVKSVRQHCTTQEHALPTSFRRKDLWVANLNCNQNLTVNKFASLNFF